MAVLNSATPPTDFSPQDYQRLIEKYLVLSKENDRLVKAIRSGDQVDINHVRQVLQTDFPLYVRLQDYFSRLRDKDLKSVDQTSFVLDDPALGDVGVPSRSIDLGMDGYPEMQLVSESDPDAMSMFTGTGASASTESPPAVPNQGPFGIRFSDYPPRVISQMLSTHTDIAASSCRWFSFYYTLHVFSPLARSLVAGIVYVGWFRARQPSEEIYEGTDDRSERYQRERSVRQKTSLPRKPTS